MPAGWPDLSSGSEDLLAPFLRCASPGDYVALQERVDMPRLVEALDDWSAVRLSALGPVRTDAADVLTRKRAAFLRDATEHQGPAHAEVFALFLLHTAHDDEVDALLRLLARDKQLGHTLALMPAVREHLSGRGLPLSAYPERAERAGDVPRGLGRAIRDALASSPASDGSRYLVLSARREQLPAPYQEASHAVERALTLRHFNPRSAARGGFDSLTFGVPLGVYYMGLSSAQGASALARGQYEQAMRELAPALLLGALYAGGKGMRALSETRSTPGSGPGGSPLQALKEQARGLEARLGTEGLRALVRDIQASREAGHFVAVGGVDAAVALRETRGQVARAQAMLAKARSEATGSSAERPGAAPRTGEMALLMDRELGLTQEVVEAKLAEMELEATGPRLSRDVGLLDRQRPSRDVPPPEARGNPRWCDYVAYYEKRLEDLRKGTVAKGPLRWASYEWMWKGFARGLAFERAMVRMLYSDAKLPRSQRRFLADFDKPRIETSVGVKKPGTGLRFADVLIIEEGESIGRPPRVETLSFKSRDLSRLDKDALKAQMIEDAREALHKYGELLDIRRDVLRPLLLDAGEVLVHRVRLIYEGGDLKPVRAKDWKAALDDTKHEVPTVEVLFQ